MSTVINTRTQSFVQALACKRDNATLSPKTLRKLTLIANREFGGRADHVFRKGLATAGYSGDSGRFRMAISSQLHSVRSPELKQILSQWLGRLPAPNALTGHPADRTSNVTAKLAGTAASGVTQWDELPAEGIPPVDYLDDAPAVHIPQPDYDDASDVVIPPADYEGAPAPHKQDRRVRFSDVVKVVHLPPANVAETRDDLRG
ncbi:hypothetical protein QE424_000842 [Stenotrophomonas rhizophila]|uniref:Uncharacterized protein n=1 Tax=Stenotrophomonas rhizophila TaxID=216778 RepID=A0AAP5AHK8_9GAMM|nr:hypothetical protein [Stenotrophomonas rhizophila]MDQ1107683.1 hypothetical protein [Stenotrophomonas rhizophila]